MQWSPSNLHWETIGFICEPGASSHTNSHMTLHTDTHMYEGLLCSFSHKLLHYTCLSLCFIQRNTPWPAVQCLCREGPMVAHHFITLSSLSSSILACLIVLWMISPSLTLGLSVFPLSMRYSSLTFKQHHVTAAASAAIGSNYGTLLGSGPSRCG